MREAEQCLDQLLIYCSSILSLPFFALLCDYLRSTTNCQALFSDQLAHCQVLPIEGNEWLEEEEGTFSLLVLFSAESKGFCVPGAPSSIQQWWQLTWPSHKWTAASFSQLEWQAKQAPQAWCSCSGHTLSLELLNLSLAGISFYLGSFFAHFPPQLRVMVASSSATFVIPQNFLLPLLHSTF